MNSVEMTAAVAFYAQLNGVGGSANKWIRNRAGEAIRKAKGRE